MDSHGFPWIPKNPTATDRDLPSSTRFTDRLHMVRAIGFAQDLHRALRKLQSIFFNDFTCQRNPGPRWELDVQEVWNMELVWNLYGIYIWNLYGLYIWNPYWIVELWPSSWWIFMFGMGWNGIRRIQQKWNDLQNIIRQDPRPKQTCRVAKWNQSEAHFLMSRAIPEASCSWFMMVFSNGIVCRTFHYINLKELQR